MPKTSEIRAKIYDFWTRETGVNMTKAQHEGLKPLLVDLAKAENEANQRQIEDLKRTISTLQANYDRLKNQRREGVAPLAQGYQEMGERPHKTFTPRPIPQKPPKPRPEPPKSYLINV